MRLPNWLHELVDDDAWESWMREHHHPTTPISISVDTTELDAAFARASELEGITVQIDYAAFNEAVEAIGEMFAGLAEQMNRTVESFNEFFENYSLHPGLPLPGPGEIVSLPLASYGDVSVFSWIRIESQDEEHLTFHNLAKPDRRRRISIDAYLEAKEAAQ